MSGLGTPEKPEGGVAPTHATRLQTGIPRSGSPAPGLASSRIGGIPRAGSPSIPVSRLGRPTSPAGTVRSASPALARPSSPAKFSKLPGPSSVPGPSSPTGIGRPKSQLPSRLGPPKSRFNGIPQPRSVAAPLLEEAAYDDVPVSHPLNGHRHDPEPIADADILEEPRPVDDITVVISSILSNDPARSVDALKKIQKVLEIGPEEGPSSPAYQDLAEHTEGLIETITLQMAHVFERPDAITAQENFRLAKHLIQTLNAFCDHTYLAESLTVDILTSLLEELTLRLLQTDNSPDSRVKDLSRFINMIILRLFATGRRMSIFRYVLQCF